MEEAVAIGIDLGTTNTVAAVMKSDGKVEIIATGQGQRTMPSYVAYNDIECLVGIPAHRQARSNPENTIYDAKRLMGRKYTDPCIQNDLKNWPFKVVDMDDFPRYQVNYKKEEKLLSPEIISKEILAEVKRYTQLALKKSITDVVITVPAYFDNSQREATIEAAHSAGLNVLRIVNEPTAAALAYGISTNTDKKRNILIFDLGGGTLDVSILILEKGCFNTKATSGDMHLGGQDFSNAMMKHLVEKFNSEKGCDMNNNQRSLERLRIACEAAKLQLSDSMEACIELDALFNGHDFFIKITRNEFEDICSSYFERTMECIEKVMADARMGHNDFDDIILVGGSSRIPKIQKMLQDKFHKELNLSVNPDEAVAHGAAIQASILKGKIRDIVLIDVIPLSIGISIRHGKMSTILPRNTPKPCRRTASYTTFADNQSEVEIKIYEGERPLVKDNHLLGQFILTDIPLAPRGVPEIIVTLAINNNGILKVTAVEKSTKNCKTLIVKRSERVSKDKIQQILQEAEENKSQDQILSRSSYQTRCRKRISDETDEARQIKYQKFLDWLEENPAEDLETIETEYKKLEVDDTAEVIVEEP